MNETTTAEAIPQDTERAPRHRWGDPVHFTAEECANGCEQTERTCLNGCGTVKITVHPPEGFPWPEWRTSDPGQYQGRRAATPPCRPKGRAL